MALRFRCERRPSSKDSDHSARPTAIRSILRYDHPMAATAKAIRARTSRMTVKLTCSIYLQSRCGSIPKCAGRHQPCEDVGLHPAGLQRRIVLQQPSCLVDRGPEDADATPRDVRLIGERA